MMRQQNGCVYRVNGKWALRWRENVTDDTGNMVRKMRFKFLGPVLPEHKRNKNRIPDEIKQLAKDFLEPLNGDSNLSPLFTIGQLVDEYFKNRIFQKPSTEAGYRKIWKRYLKPELSSVAVREFKLVDAHRLWKQVHKTFPNLGRQTMTNIRSFVANIFLYARNNGYYPQTPDSLPFVLDHKRLRIYVGALPQDLRGKKETEAYTSEEVKKLLNLLTSPKSQAIVALLWGSGIRKGECAGLDWRDWEKTETGAVVYIRRSVWKGRITKPKTESSADVVHVGPEVVAYVEAYRQFIGNVDEGFMFGTAKKPINLELFVRYQLKPLMAKAGLKYKGLHGFRRASATHLAKNITSGGTEAARLQLRHADSGTTALYIKNTKQERRAEQARKELERVEQKQTNAVILGAGLRQTEAVQ